MRDLAPDTAFVNASDTLQITLRGIKNPAAASDRRQLPGVRKPWLGRVSGSVATPVKFPRKLKTNST